MVEFERKITVSIDDNPIAMNQRVRIDVKDGLLILNIGNAVLEDAGVYRILVRNQASEITTSCTLNVYEKIQPTETPPLFTNTIKGKGFCVSEINIVNCSTSIAQTFLYVIIFICLIRR